MRKQPVALVLAGGQGRRLGLLTDEVAKPAIPFGGKYRIIDFSLSNCVNSGIYNVGVLTQYRPHLLSRHIGIGRPWDLDRKGGGVTILPPYTGMQASDWYTGTANAVFQNAEFINGFDPEIIVILSGDHVYGMDYNEMIDYHLSKGASGTIACMRVPLSESKRFGMVVTDFENRVVDFQEKPEKPRSDLASLGIYVFNWPFLKERLIMDEADPNSENDFGKNVLPKIVEEGAGDLFSFVFDGYWRDVGTLLSYWKANLELVRPIPPLNLHDPSWKYYTQTQEYPPAFVGTDSSVRSSLINEGSEICATVENSVIFQGVKVRKGAVIRDSVIMSDTIVEKDAYIEKAIIGERTIIGAEVKIGVGEPKSNRVASDVYSYGLAVIGSDVAIPPGISIGKNVAIGNHCKEEVFEGDVESGETIKRK